MADITRPERTFNWIAPIYDALAFLVFGNKLQQAQAYFLREIPPDGSILIVGGGSGWLLERVLVEVKSRRIVYLDSSSRMVTQASRRILRKGILGTVEFRANALEALQVEQAFDVIITPFFLDLFAEETLRSSLIPQLRHMLKTGGQWFITDFIPTSVWWQKQLLWVMIRFFRLTAGIETRQLVDWQQLIAGSKLQLQKRQSLVNGMVSSEIWACQDQ